jgi:alginate O-acetyltransferase complex protein AlgI
MALPHIFVFSLVSALVGGLARGRWREWLLLILSLLALYALQPATPIRYLDFWLPTTSLGLTVLVWVVTQASPASPVRPTPGAAPAENPAAGPDILRPTLISTGIIGAVIMLIAATRYLDRSWVSWLTPSRPPDVLLVIIALALSAAAGAALARFLPGQGAGSLRLVSILVWVLIGMFVVLKTDVLAGWASMGLRALMQQSVTQASALDWRWLGFSYITFRLIHALRDRLSKRLPVLSLSEFVTYALFFPALTAGPIDRADRFVKDLRQPAPAWAEGGTRLAVGIFKKFVLADTLALLALSAQNAAQARSTFWLWILLYAYAGRIYFDFSGYTDIALGLGRLLGFKLPENFDQPYLKANLTLFWNSWHMSLAQWFRAYFFNPLTRALRSRPLPPWLIILIGQAGTMVLIGLWHGVTWNFAVWGAWHAVGLFAHSRYAEFARPRLAWLDARPALKRAAAAAGTLFTFHYVALGWVWFALPSLNLSLRVFGKLFGLSF